MFKYKGYLVHDAMIGIDAQYEDPHEAIISLRVLSPEGEQLDATEKQLMLFIDENYAELSSMCATLHAQWLEAGQPPAQPVTRH